MSNERQSEIVKVYNVEAFEAKVRELNKKAAKAGVASVTYNLGTVWNKETFWQRVDGDDVEVVYFYKECAIYFDQIIYPGGWQLIGVIDHTENLVKSVPGAGGEPLVPFLERGPVCDHCHTQRDRSETFVLRGEQGSLVQVGRSCIHLFLGVAVERALSGIGLSSGLGGLDEEQRQGRVPFGYGLVDFLSTTAAVIRLYGWRSRSNVYNGGVIGQATADLAWDSLENARNRAKSRQGVPLWVEPTVEDKETAVKTAEWLKGLASRSGLNDFLSNLAQIGQAEFVSAKSNGFAAAAINAWGKEQELEIKKAAEREQSGVVNEYIGEVGAKLAVNATLVKSPGFDTAWGYTFIHRFITDDGHVLTWKTGTELDKGRYSLKAAVKEHGEYRGEKQTIITRAKLVKLPEPVAA